VGSAKGKEARSMEETGAELMVLVPSLFNGTLLDTIAKNRKREYGVKNR
jgi:hypothetical protein